MQKARQLLHCRRLLAHNFVQPIGGVNAKIEGFYDACKLQGLTGKQGVIIPRQNITVLTFFVECTDRAGH
jgi:hypothetical protein